MAQYRNVVTVELQYPESTPQPESERYARRYGVAEVVAEDDWVVQINYDPMMDHDDAIEQLEKAIELMKTDSYREYITRQITGEEYRSD